MHEFKSSSLKDFALNSECRLSDCRFEGYKENIPELCYSLMQYYATWLSPNYYMSLAAIMYRYRDHHYSAHKWKKTPFIEFESFSRSVFLKYADRGLVNDRYYYNMNMSLFNGLFWFSNIFLLTINQGMIWVHYFNGESPYQNTYR